MYVDLVRSEPMQLSQLIIPMESAHRTIPYLGDLGLFQFKDGSCTTRFTLQFYNRLNAEKSPLCRECMLISLAHSELSSVLYERVLLLSWGFNNFIMLIISILVFICELLMYYW